MRVICGDNRKWLGTLAENSVDAVVTDPPYELGFMGKGWDATGIAYDPELWGKVLRVLKPGGYLLAFGASRTYHRLACAIQDAEFELRDSMMWIYGSGFPKSLNVGGGLGTALKPAYEPIVMARKSLIGTVVENLAAHGTGAIDIDDCRVGAEARHNPPVGEHVSALMSYDGKEGPGTDVVGRWPANVLHDGVLADEEWGRYFYCAKASKADREEGLDDLPLVPQGVGALRDKGRSDYTGGELTGRKDGSAGLSSPRAGAGRGGGRRNSHPTVKPEALMRYLVRLVCPAGGLVLDPFMGSGSTGKAAALERRDFIGMDLSSEYCRIAAARIEAALSRATGGDVGGAVGIAAA